MIQERLWADPNRPVWAEKGWNVVIDNLPYLQAAIAYVENNPLKEGKKRQQWLQQWRFVTPLDDYLRLI